MLLFVYTLFRHWNVQSSIWQTILVQEENRKTEPFKKITEFTVVRSVYYSVVFQCYRFFPFSEFRYSLGFKMCNSWTIANVFENALHSTTKWSNCTIGSFYQNLCTCAAQILCSFSSIWKKWIYLFGTYDLLSHLMWCILYPLMLHYFFW